MIVVDTNVISEVIKPRPDRSVLTWIGNGDPRELYLCDVTMMELEFGAERHWLKHASAKYRRFIAEFVEVKFRNNILSLGRDAFVSAGRIRARREMSGRTISPQGSMIAAICLHHSATLATRNTKDFEGLDLTLVNPFEGA